MLYNGSDPLQGFIERERLQPFVGRLIPKREALRLEARGYRFVTLSQLQLAVLVVELDHIYRLDE